MEVSIQTSTLNRSCRVAVNFMPQIGKNYEAYYVETDRKCTIKVFEIQPILDVNQLATISEVKDIKGCSQLGDRSF